MAHDREVAGLRCTEVLAHLSDYLDGDAAPELSARIEAHVAGCDWCERFGGRFASVVGGLRRSLGRPEPADAALLRRIAARLSDGS